MTGPIEREVKLAYASPDAARRAILAVGATPLRVRRLQHDRLLDRQEDPLSARQCALRIRSDGAEARVTFKGAPMPGLTKAREELETTVGEASRLLELFERLGYRVCFEYQKYREEFRHGALVIALDEAPIGTYVELEGEEADVLAMAAALGRTPAEFVLDSYRTLFLQHRDATGTAATHMLFDEP